MACNKLDTQPAYSLEQAYHNFFGEEIKVETETQMHAAVPKRLSRSKLLKMLGEPVRK
jgi:hypothetical protein